MVDRQVTFDNLILLLHNIDYNYETDEATYTVNAKTQTIKTGKRKPVIDNEVTLRNEYHFKYDVKDPDGAIDHLRLNMKMALFIDVDEKNCLYQS